MTQADRECTKARCPLNRKCQGEVHTSCLQGLLKICASLRWPGHLNGEPTLTGRNVNPRYRSELMEAGAAIRYPVHVEPDSTADPVVILNLVTASSRSPGPRGICQKLSAAPTCRA